MPGRCRPAALRARALRAAALAAVVGLLAGCVGTGATDGVRDDRGAAGARGNDQRFVAGDGSIRLVDPAQRRPAPGVRGELLDGTAYDTAALRGRVVVLNFWASWCAPCIAEAADLERVWQRTRPLGVQFLGVNVKDDRANAATFLRSHAVTFPSLYDQPGIVALRFRDSLPPAAIPSTLVLDRTGRVAARALGGLTEDELEPVVRRVAGERA